MREFWIAISRKCVGLTRESRDSRPITEENLHQKIGQQAVEIDFLKKTLRRLGLSDE